MSKTYDTETNSYIYWFMNWITFTISNFFEIIKKKIFVNKSKMTKIYPSIIPYSKECEIIIDEENNIHIDINDYDNNYNYNNYYQNIKID